MNQTKVEVDHSGITDGDLGEIYQSMETKQAIACATGEGKYKRLTKWVLCRDFLVDTYSYAKAGKNFPGVYGFSYKGELSDLPWNQTILLQQFPNTDTKAKFLAHLPKLNVIEKLNGLKLTQTFETQDEKVLLVIGSKRWLDNCLKFSLYSLFLRILCYKLSAAKDPIKWIVAFGKHEDDAEDQSSDSEYIESVKESVWKRIIPNLRELDTPEFCGFKVGGCSVGTIHHNSGFISVFGNHSELTRDIVVKNSHWKLMTERKFELYTTIENCANEW